MNIPENFKPSYYEDKSVKALLIRFLIRHGEKFAVVLVVSLCISFILGIRDYQPLPWQPHELKESARDAETVILNNEDVESEGKMRMVDFASLAVQIKDQIALDSYRSFSAWMPVLHAPPQLRRGVDVLAAHSLSGQAVRQTGIIRSMPGTVPNDPPSLWINLYGTIPFWEQWDIHHQIFDDAFETGKPDFAYYEIEKAVILSNEEPIWMPVVLFPDSPNRIGRNFDLPLDRLVPLEQQSANRQETILWQQPDFLLFSDFDIQPDTTYAYRIRLYLANPNYNVQETFVEESVDTASEFIRSDWSPFARVYVPERTTVSLKTLIPSDQANFPRQAVPLRPAQGTFGLDYFDIELGKFLPTVEKSAVQRGMLLNMSKEDANRFINRGKTPDEFVHIHFPDTGLRSGIAVMDYRGGRLFQKRATREALQSPDLSVQSEVLLLMPDGTMQIQIRDSQTMQTQTRDSQ